VRQRDDVSALGSLDGGLKIRAWFDTGELGALDQAVQERGDFGASTRARPVVIFSADNNSS